MKYLVLVNEYAPDFSANSNCLRMVLNVLAEQHEIHILCITGVQQSADSKGRRYEEYSNSLCGVTDDETTDDRGRIKVYRIYNSHVAAYNNLEDMRSKKPFCYLCQKVRNKVYIEFVWPDFSMSVYKPFLKKAVSFIESGTYDGMITSSGDFFVQCIGIKLKKQFHNLPWIAYFNDPLPYNNFQYTNRKSTILNVKKIQESLLSYAGLLIFEEQLYNKYQKELTRWKYKMTGAGIPLLAETDVNQQSMNEIASADKNKGIRVVFAGTLYRRIRNPQYILDIFSMLTLDYSLDIYGGGDCDSILDEYQWQVPINRCGTVSQKSIKEVINNDCVLLNIGNTITEQLPCKIIEYIATGRPIINVIKSADDVSKSLIDLYGNGVNIMEYEPKELSKQKLLEFLSSNKNRRIDFSVLKQQFVNYTPEYTAGKIDSFMKIHTK